MFFSIFAMVARIVLVSAFPVATVWTMFVLYRFPRTVSRAMEMLATTIFADPFCPSVQEIFPLL